MSERRYIRQLSELGLDDIPQVGGKNASLGEMIQALSASGIQVPDGFVVTAEAYRYYLEANQLTGRIYEALDGLETGDVEALASTAARIRSWITKARIPNDLAGEIRSAYADLAAKFGPELDVAVRSSATAEDLPGASFAGQQETYLNIRGADHLLQTCKQVLASLFTARAISYRVHHGFEHSSVALSIGVQKMVRADKGVSGVIFTLDTESGFRDVVLIASAYGLGENVVSGAVNPDEFLVFKPTLNEGRRPILRRQLGDKKFKMIYADADGAGVATRNVDVRGSEQAQFSITDDEVLALARIAVLIEKHYSGRAGHTQPMDIEWAKDGISGELFVVQARPETVHSIRPEISLESYTLTERGELRAVGKSIGKRIGAGRARIITDPEHMAELQPGEVLVTDMTDPAWEPVMKSAAAIVTNRGGRVCHAAIIARELGIPAVVGTGDATRTIEDGEPVTVCCAEGDEGKVYAGELAYSVEQYEPGDLPRPRTKVMLNVGNPGRAFEWSLLPNDGVGLARLEFIIADTIGIHPRALLEYENLAPDLRQQISDRLAGFSNPVDFYINRLAEGVGTIAAAFYPKPVIARMSDFKSNEYAALLGGKAYEPVEENPMLGLRGAARYYSEEFGQCFELECAAMVKVREEMGLTNLELLIPFVRTPSELVRVIALMGQHGLQRGDKGLRIHTMCELPSNVIRASEFLEYCDGFSIGSNDLTQLTLGVDRDSQLLADFDERDEAVMDLIAMAI
ncbi:MAG: phosphoenolpyruvate synthase, partial [Gammaproteobacteria bacterium]|nr:phosphoenolpyruvate synthase [Gammaproteobacteria bacterium]